MRQLLHNYEIKLHHSHISREVTDEGGVRQRHSIVKVAVAVL